jgi:hypothetical protein
MVDTEDNFNEFLKQKVEESHFEYNEAYWLKAEKLIENAQPKRKPFWLGFGLGMLSLAIIGGVASMVMINSSSKNQKVQSTQISLASLNVDAPKANLQSNTAVTSTLVSTLPVEAEKNQSQKTPADKAIIASASTKNSSYNKNKQTKVQNTVLHSQVGRNKNNHATNVTASVDDGNVAYHSQVRDLTNPKLIESAASESTNEDEGQEATVITIAEPFIMKAKKPAVKDIDVNIVAACENKNKHEWMFNLLAGVSDSRGFEGNTVSTSRIGFGYFGGFRLAYKIDKNWFVGVQPLLYSRGAVNTSVQTEKTAYDFGANADEFIVKNKALLFAEMPVSIGYRIQRHQISIGAGLEYLVNVKSDVKDFGTTDYTPNQWGYTDGFNRLGTIALFNYAFNVYNELWLTMMVQKGFTDLTKANYFTTNSKDKNFNLRIGVQYQFNNQKKKGK